jgi:hypothetical protein
MRVTRSLLNPAKVLLLGRAELRQVCTPCVGTDLAKDTHRLISTLEEFRATHGFGRGIAGQTL